MELVSGAQITAMRAIGQAAVMWASAITALVCRRTTHAGHVQMAVIVPNVQRMRILHDVMH